MRFVRCCIFLFFLLLSWGELSAATNQFSVLHYQPSFGFSDYLTTRSSNLMKQNQWRFGSQFEYAYRSLEFTNTSNTIQRMIDHLTILHMHAAYAPTDWWEVELQMPFILYQRFRQAVTPVPAAQRKQGVGDIRLTQRFSLWQARTRPVGLSLAPFVTFPVGQEDLYLADDGWTYGLVAIFDRKWNDWLDQGFNIGFQFRQKRIQFQNDLDVHHHLLMSMGLKANIYPNISLVTDLWTKTNLANPFQEKVASPTEWMLAGEYHNGPVKVRAGAGLSMIRGSGESLMRTFVDFTWYPGEKSKVKRHVKTTQNNRALTKVKVKVDKKVTKEKIDIPVQFAFNQFVLSKRGQVNLDRIIKKIKLSKQMPLVEIVGHADNIGPKQANDLISFLRAKAAAEYLIKKGVSPTQIAIMARGSQEPIASNATRAGRAQNRRVDIFISPP